MLVDLLASYGHLSKPILVNEANLHQFPPEILVVRFFSGNYANSLVSMGHLRMGSRDYTIYELVTRSHRQI